MADFNLKSVLAVIISSINKAVNNHSSTYLNILRF